MREKNNGNSNSLGVCQRIFNFVIQNILALGFKPVTLRQHNSFGPPAKTKGEMILVHYQDHENSKDDLGSEIQVHFKQSEGMESWTPVEKFADHAQVQKPDGIPDQVRTEKGKKKVSEEKTGLKKELPLLQEETDRPLSKRSPNLPTAPLSRDAKKMVSINESEEKERNKKKEKAIPNGNLTTLPIQNGEVKTTPRRLIASPSINERSDAYIKRRKEAMSKNV